MGTSEDEAAAKKVATIKETNAETADRAIRYANFITLGGYAGAFTVWNFTRDQLTPGTTILVALLLAASLVVFVFFEVFKTMMGNKHLAKYRELIHRDPPPATFLEQHRKIKDQVESDMNRIWFPTWRACWTFSVITALGAIMLLIYNFVAILLGLPLWP